jgi:hypothetical protein
LKPLALFKNKFLISLTNDALGMLGKNRDLQSAIIAEK